jgi:hypothetical protein
VRLYNSIMSNDYKAVFARAVEEFSAILKERQELDLKLVQKEQFIRATLHQLPDSDRAIVENWADTWSSSAAGLSDSIRSVLSASPQKWHTATEVRNALEKAGFDFGNYASNPLASVHSSLKRFKPEEAEMEVIDGVMAWRWKKQVEKSRFGPRRRRNPLFSPFTNPYGSPHSIANMMANQLGIFASGGVPIKTTPAPEETHEEKGKKK